MNHLDQWKKGRELSKRVAPSSDENRLERLVCALPSDRRLSQYFLLFPKIESKRITKGYVRGRIRERKTK